MSATSVELAALRTFPEAHELNQLAKMIRLNSDLAGLTVETIESKFVVEARDLVDRHATGFGATSHSSDKCWKKYHELMPKCMRSGKRYVKDNGSKKCFKILENSEDANAAVDQVYIESKI
jgi:hypothetical protein